MTCPQTNNWDLLAMEALQGPAAEPLLAHLGECPGCRKSYEEARRSHLDRVRMYDQFDRGHDSLREQLMAALPPEPARSHADGLVRGWRHMGDFTMSIKHRIGARATIGLLSAAACIGLAIVLSMMFAGGRSAFAAAIEQFRSATTIVCRVSSSPTAAGPVTMQQSGKLYFSAEHGSRYECSLNGIPMMTQYSPLQGPATTVTPMTRSYTVVDYQAAGDSPQSQNSADSFLRALSRLQGEATRELGRQNLDGIEALGYEIPGQLLGLGSGEGIRSELWIDAKTYLPVRYVAEIPTPAMPEAGIKAGTVQMVYDEFEWDQPLEPQLFVPEIPAGFTRMDARMPAPDESALIKGLGNYAELAGHYPAEMSAATVVTDFSAAVGARMGAARARGEKPDQQALMQKSVEIGSGITFYQKLAKEGGSPEYYGKAVEPGQGDAVLVRWRLPTGESRVIYGDLRVETVKE